MSTPVIYGGVTYNIPSFGDGGYAQGAGNLSLYLIALATGSLTTGGGPFTLLSDTNFGPTFGLIAVYYKSATANIASAGVLRLANTDAIEWRNFANSGNDVLAVNASDQLIYNGVVITTAATTAITALTGDVTATGPGSVPATLATVNANVGSFTSANITVNAKGLITAASNGGGTVTSVSGTANQINSTGGNTPVLSLSSTLVLPGTFNANGTKLTNIASGTAAQDAVALTQLTTGNAITAGGIANATITTTQIASNTIATGNIAANAITHFASDITTGTAGVGTLIASAAITTVGGAVLVIGMVSVESASAFGQWVVTLFRDSTQIGPDYFFSTAINTGVGDNGATIPFIDTPGAGTYTYKLYYTALSGGVATVWGHSLQAIELKR